MISVKQAGETRKCKTAMIFLFSFFFYMFGIFINAKPTGIEIRKSSPKMEKGKTGGKKMIVQGLHMPDHLLQI